MWRNLKKHVEDEVTLPALTVSNATVTSSPAESVLYAHRYHEMRGVLEKELRARKARGEFAAREDVDEAAKLRAGRGLRLPKAKGSGNAESPEAWTLALRAMTDHAALFGANPTSKCPKTLDTDEAALEALPSALAAVEQTRLDVAQAFLSVAFEAMSPQSVWKSRFYGAFVLHHRVVLDAIDAASARWRGAAGSSPLDGARTAASSPRNDLVKNCRVHPTHWLISTQVAT